MSANVPIFQFATLNNGSVMWPLKAVYILVGEWLDQSARGGGGLRRSTHELSNRFVLSCLKLSHTLFSSGQHGVFLGLNPETQEGLRRPTGTIGVSFQQKCQKTNCLTAYTFIQAWACQDKTSMWAFFFCLPASLCFICLPASLFVIFSRTWWHWTQKQNLMALFFCLSDPPLYIPLWFVITPACYLNDTPRGGGCLHWWRDITLLLLLFL